MPSRTREEEYRERTILLNKIERVLLSRSSPELKEEADYLEERLKYILEERNWLQLQGK